MKKISTIKRIDDTTFEINDYEQHQFTKTFEIKYRTLLLIVLTIFLIGIVLFFCKDIHKNHNETSQNEFQNNLSQNNESPSHNESTSSDEYIPFSKDGFIFPQSSSQYITLTDLQNLKINTNNHGLSYEELLGYSINEIYARHGYLFIAGEEFDSFYTQYQWYIDTEKTSEVTWDKFNSYEQHNISLFVEEEKRCGFRQ